MRAKPSIARREARTLREFFPVTRVPALKLSAWTFTGATEF